MLVAIDESGCTGMKLGAGSSTFFVVVAVLFKDKSEGSRCYQQIDSLKAELKVKKEFRFSGCSHDMREAFLARTASFDYEYFGIVVDKSKLASRALTLSKPFTQTPILALFPQFAPELEDATVVIDKTGSDDFRKSLAKELRSSLNETFDREVIRKVKNLDSHKHNLIQLADMVCGAVARSYNTSRTNHLRYRDIIRHRETAITDWP